MRRPRQAAVGLEPLESRALLSSVPHRPAHEAATAAFPLPFSSLRGHLTGRYSAAPPANAAGASIALVGQGEVRPLGPVTVSGLVAIDPAPGGAIQGGLVLGGPAGQVEVGIDGVVPTGARPIPPQKVVILGGTGAFEGTSGAGIIRIQQATALNPSLMGSFSLTIHTFLASPTLGRPRPSL
jgi:hypothetical protein